nr:MAG TPA: hypothetical protein [Caudoviricetes sp.]
MYSFETLPSYYFGNKLKYCRKNINKTLEKI